MTFQSPLARRACVAAAAVLLSSGLVAVAAPVGATSDTLNYNCTSSPDIGSHVFAAVIDTDAPVTLGSGLTAPIKTTSTVTIPEDIADLLRLGSVNYVSGTATATGTVGGVNRQTTLTIPNTTVPPDGTTMQVVGTGASGSITAGAAGSSILIGAGNFAATLTGYNTAGTAVAGPYTFTCTLQASQNLLVDTVSVVPAPTTTTITVLNSPVAYGDAPVVKAEVVAPGSNGKPDGSIEFAFDGKTVKVDLKAGRAKATLAAALTMGNRAVTAKYTPNNANWAPSAASKAVTVVRDQTTTTATTVFRDRRNRLVGKALVEALHGTEVAGQVKFNLKRDGVRIRTALVDLNQFDRAKKVFKNIGKPGTYLLIARYLGSGTLKRSVDKVKLNL